MMMNSRDGDSVAFFHGVKARFELIGRRRSFLIPCQLSDLRRLNIVSMLIFTASSFVLGCLNVFRETSD